MDHHSVREAPLHQRSLLQIVAKHPAPSHLKNNAIQGDKLCCRLDVDFGLMPSFISEAPIS